MTDTPNRFGRPAPSDVNPALRTGSLFSGVGGLDIAVRWVFPARPQGFPAGWFTAVPGVDINDGLRLAGNSVNPYQAAAALAWCLARLTDLPTDAEGGAAA